MVHIRFLIEGRRIAQIPEGAKAMRVAARLIRTILSAGTHSLNRKTGLAAHQKFATLSSYRPLPTGKILFTTYAF